MYEVRYGDGGIQEERTERKPHVQFKDSKARRMSLDEIICSKTRGDGEEREKERRGKARGERRAQPVVTRTK